MLGSACLFCNNQAKIWLSAHGLIRIFNRCKLEKSQLESVVEVQSVGLGIRASGCSTSWPFSLLRKPQDNGRKVLSKVWSIFSFVKRNDFSKEDKPVELELGV